MLINHPATAGSRTAGEPTVSATARRIRLALSAVAFAVGLSACAAYEPKEFTADDRCRECEGGGLFSGSDGAFSIDINAGGNADGAGINSDDAEDSGAQQVSAAPPSTDSERAAIEQRIDQIINEMGALQDELTRLRRKLKK